MLSNDKVQTRFHQVEKNHCVWGSELGPVLCRKKGRYVELIRLHILVDCMELHWRQPCSDPVAPCVIKKGREDRRKKKREVLHLFRCYTHKWLCRALPRKNPLVFEHSLNLVQAAADPTVFDPKVCLVMSSRGNGAMATVLS